jgi:hypothetical protein
MNKPVDEIYCPMCERCAVENCPIKIKKEEEENANVQK